jgi:hypothetical protein
METITLNNGVEQSALGLGVYQPPPDETQDAVRSAALAHGDAGGEARPHGRRCGVGGVSGGRGLRGGGAPDSAASTCGSARARASVSGRGSSVINEETRPRSSVCAEASARFPLVDSATD